MTQAPDAGDERHTRLFAASHPRRMTFDDAARVARLFAAAFADDPVFNWIARADAKRAAGLDRFFFWLLHARAIPFGECWMADDASVAAAWLPPNAPATAGGIREQMRLLPIILRLCGMPRLLRGIAMADAMDKHHPHAPHFYLAFIAVAPRYQGMGLGSALLEHTLSRVDQQGMPAYLENSNPKNARLYERAGFSVTKEMRARADAPPMWTMWREPRPRLVRSQGSSSLSQ